MSLRKMMSKYSTKVQIINHKNRQGMTADVIAGWPSNELLLKLHSDGNHYIHHRSEVLPLENEKEENQQTLMEIYYEYRPWNEGIYQDIVVPKKKFESILESPLRLPEIF